MTKLHIFFGLAIIGISQLEAVRGMSLSELSSLGDEVNEASSMLNDAKEIYDDLMGNEVATKPPTVHKGYNFGSCLKLAGAASDAPAILGEGVKLAWNVAQELFQILMNVLHCTQHDMFKAVSCYSDNLNKVKLVYHEINVALRPLRDMTISTLKVAHKDFNTCLGF